MTIPPAAIRSGELEVGDDVVVRSDGRTVSPDRTSTLPGGDDELREETVN
ncbi:MAG: hypothetical protein ABEJ28_01740 [Salinigranum sp.]